MSDVKPVAWMPDAVFEALVFETTVNACVSVVKLIPEDVPLYNKAAIDALQAEIEALRKDGERWQFICQDAYETVVPHGVKIDGSRTAWIPHLLVGKSYEAAVDAAIAKEK